MIFITGGRGYIGSNLMAYFKDVESYDIVDGLDILDKETLRSHMKGAKYVYHCAAIGGVKACDEDKVKASRLNIDGTTIVVELAEKLNVRPILFSSRAALCPKTYYGLTKRVVENCFKERAVILRLSNVFGGLNYNKKRGNVINRFAYDDPIVVYGGEQKRDFVHMDEVIAACMRAQELPYDVHDVCSREEIRIRKLAEIIQIIRHVPIVYEPPRPWE
jgi:nucleoside-diphosphate-sugar epimerase